MSVATIDPGRPNLLMDHLQLGLRNGSAAEPHFYLSLYVIPWSRELGAGHVALLRSRGRHHVRYVISAVDLEVESRWDDLGEAIFAYGPAPQRPDEQRIWSLLFEAGRASGFVNGSEVSGETYAMDSWIPWLGRSLSSAHVARGEILVDNASG